MPDINVNRRIIGRDIIQKYVEDGGDSGGGGDMIKTGLFISAGVSHLTSIGFKPKILMLSVNPTSDPYFKPATYIFTEQGYTTMEEVEIKDYTNVARKSMRQFIRNTPSLSVEFYDQGFVTDIEPCSGFYIAIG